MTTLKPRDCDHRDPKIITEKEHGDVFEYTVARCKCLLKGPSWHFAANDLQGRENARAEVLAWWSENMVNQ